MAQTDVDTLAEQIAGKQSRMGEPVASAFRAWVERLRGAPKLTHAQSRAVGSMLQGQSLDVPGECHRRTARALVKAGLCMTYCPNEFAMYPVLLLTLDYRSTADS